MEIRAHELVRAVMAETGIHKNTELARKLKLDMSGPKNVSRWKKGDHEPEFEPTIGLLRLGGYLNEKKLYEALAQVQARQAQDEAARAEEHISRLGEVAPARPQRAKKQANPP